MRPGGLHAFQNAHRGGQYLPPAPAWNELGLRGATALVADLPAVLQRARALRDELVAGALKATQNLGSAQKSGRATLLGPGLVEIGGKAHATRSIIIATGSRPRLPDAWLAFGDRMLKIGRAHV